MKKKFQTWLLMLMILATLPWFAGCGQGEQAATPEKADEFRQQQVDRTQRMLRETSKSQ